MYIFKNDYSEGAHPRILDALTKTNLEQTEGYGYDGYTHKAELTKYYQKKNPLTILEKVPLGKTLLIKGYFSSFPYGN